MGKGERVCVTGASGFIGSWVVRLLLEDGYSVNATVQSLEDKNETQHLELMAADLGAKERMKLWQVELQNYDSLAAAIAGCSGVFHLACPNIIGKVEHPKEALVDPAVEGTLNVLRAAKASNVRRVVITSSISAMIPNPNWDMHTPVDEDCWTDLDYCKANQLWYPIAKTEAERAAWRYAEQEGVDVVAVNPGTVLGPIFPPSINSSTAMLLGLLKGCKDTYGDFWMGCVHVKDVARAQVILFENPIAKGRHLCLSKIFPYSDFADVVHRLFPHYSVPRLKDEKRCVWNSLEFEEPSKKLMKLGMVFGQIEDAIKDSVVSLQLKSFIPKPIPN